MTASLPPPRPAAQRIAVLALLAAFVLAQALGWIHRGLHGEASVPRVAGAVHEVELAEPTLFDGLFGSHADASDCRLFDVVAHPALASAKLIVPPLAPAPAVLLAGLAGIVTGCSAPFDARGPPHSR